MNEHSSRSHTIFRMVKAVSLFGGFLFFLK